jgi:hypothetical protein
MQGFLNTPSINIQNWVQHWITRSSAYRLRCQGCPVRCVKHKEGERKQDSTKLVTNNSHVSLGHASWKATEALGKLWVENEGPFLTLGWKTTAQDRVYCSLWICNVMRNVAPRFDVLWGGLGRNVKIEINNFSFYYIFILCVWLLMRMLGESSPLTIGVVAAELGVGVFSFASFSSGKQTRSFLDIWLSTNMRRHIMSVVKTNKKDPIRYQSIILG